MLILPSPAYASEGACTPPNIIERAIGMTEAPGVTQADIEVLREFLKNNDRAGMYLMLYRLTGDEFWLMDAQITTFSGIWGGTALEANYQIKLHNEKKYQESLDKFSLKIATNMLKWVEASVNEGAKGFVDSSVLLMKGDGEIWKSKGLYNEYPGRVLFFNLGQYSLSDLPYIFGSGSYYSSIAGFKKGGLLGKRPAEFAGNPNFTIYNSIDKRFVTVIDNRTCKVEAFIDKAARPLGVLEQIPDTVLSKDDPKYYQRLWTWEFMQGNQDTAEEYNASVWVNGFPLPDPNIVDGYFHNEDDEEWYRVRDGRKVTDQNAKQLLDIKRGQIMKFRIYNGFPPVPELPGRYLD